MSANLFMQDGKASMMFVGELPWHGLGTPLAKPATAREAIEAAQLDWRVSKRPLFVQHGHRRLETPDRHAIVRETAEPAVLGIVGGSYTPVQNSEAFAFFDPIVGKDAAIYHTAGALGRGEKVWILAKLPDTFRVVGDDIAEKYLLLSNSHDGRLCLQIKFTPVRVVCQNTLTLAMQGGADVKLKHHQDIRQRMREAEVALGLIHHEFDEIEEAFRGLSKIQVNGDRLKLYLGRVFPEPEDGDDLAKQRIQRDREFSAHLFEEGRGNRLPGVRGTLWAALNGVTEWIDHRKVRQSRDQRLNSLWFGEGSRVKARAFGTAKELAALWN